MGAADAVRVRRGAVGDAPALAGLRWSWAHARNSPRQAGAADYLEVHPSEGSLPFYRLGFDGAGQTLRFTLRCPR